MAKRPTQNSGRAASRRGRPENLKPWQPGQSGNPGGRPRGVVAYLKARYGEDGERLIEELDAIAFDRTISARIRHQALSELLDRGWGRPTQTLSVNTDAAVPIFADNVDIDTGGLPNRGSR